MTKYNCGCCPRTVLRINCNIAGCCLDKSIFLLVLNCRAVDHPCFRILRSLATYLYSSFSSDLAYQAAFVDELQDDLEHLATMNTVLICSYVLVSVRVRILMQIYITM